MVDQCLFLNHTNWVMDSNRFLYGEVLYTKITIRQEFFRLYLKDGIPLAEYFLSFSKYSVEKHFNRFS